MTALADRRAVDAGALALFGLDTSALADRDAAIAVLGAFDVSLTAAVSYRDPTRIADSSTEALLARARIHVQTHPHDGGR